MSHWEKQADGTFRREPLVVEKVWRVHCDTEGQHFATATDPGTDCPATPASGHVTSDKIEQVYFERVKDEVGNYWCDFRTSAGSTISAKEV